MLLKLLYDFAHSRNLLDDLAFEAKPVRWIIKLNSDGTLRGKGPVETAGEKNRGKPLPCPRIIGDTNSGKIADFLVEGVDGVFGISPNPEKPKNLVKLAAKKKNFWDQIQECYNTTEVSTLGALLNFHEGLAEGLPSFLVQKNGSWFVISSQGDHRKLMNDEFTFEVNDELLLRNEKVCDYWRGKFYELSDDDEDENNEPRSGVCLLTGEVAQISRTHNPKIQGIPNTQGGGAKIVSFEKSSPSFSSFGFRNSYNAPVSKNAATAYCVALRKLLVDSDNYLNIGQTSVCFWARETKEASSFSARMLKRPDPVSVATFLKSPWSGVDREHAKLDQFYSVTLAGNSGRIIVRHWMQITLEVARENLWQWFHDLEIITYGNTSTQIKRKPKLKSDGSEAHEEIPPLALYRLACATVRDPKEDLQSETLSQLYRTSLEGVAPSLVLLKQILNRVSADICRFGIGVLETPISGKAMQKIRDSKTPIPPPGQSRMALLKIVLNRNAKKGEPMIEPKIFETDDPAYNCGRLLAIFDSLQRSAHGSSFEGSTIAERYFGSASSTPNTAFSILWKLHQHHLRKLRQQGEKGQRAVAKIKASITQIAVLFEPKVAYAPPQFPRYFTMVEQGRFALGFYQQMAKRREEIEE